VEVHRPPLGVVAAILAWNFPLAILAYKLAPAIVTGNTIVVKPAPSTPLSALFVGELIKDLVPRGVVNILSDDGEVAPVLVAHPGVAKIAFTGSTKTGKAVYANAASTVKRVTLELGGNDAAIVLPNVDVRKIAPKLFAAMFGNSGQICLSLKRLYVHTSIYDEVCDELAVLARNARVGDGFDPETEFGPVQNRNQFQQLKEVLAEVATAGTIIAGAEVKDGPGFFVAPTLVRDVSDDCRLVKEEIFGPIRPILRYDDMDDAIRRANDSCYGLGASVWSNDVELAARLARRIEAGTVWVISILN